MGTCACPTTADGGRVAGGMIGGMRMMHGADAGMRMGRMGGTMAMTMPQADVRVDDVEGGARITLLARNAADVTALRDHARMHVEHMRSGGCPMM